MDLVAVVTSVKGDVQVRRDTDRSWIDASNGVTLRTGDAVRTKSSGSCVIKWARGNIMKLTPFTEIVLDKLMVTPATKTEMNRLALRKGLIFAKVKKLEGDSSFSITTPTAIAAVRGTRFSVQIDAEGATIVKCSEGELSVKNHRGDEVILGEGRKVEVRVGRKPGEPTDMSEEEFKDFLGQREINIPDMVVLEPAGDMEVTKTPLRIRGFADPAVTITINGKRSVVSASGEFEKAVALDVGKNWIIIEAKNSSGNTLKKEYKITYFPSVRNVAAAEEKNVVETGGEDEVEMSDWDSESLEIDYPPAGYLTRDMSITVSGKKPVGTSMLVVNGRPVEDAAPLSKSFSTRADLLLEGKNVIEVSAVRGDKLMSDSVSVVRDTIAPDVTIVKPTGQFDVTTGDCELIGTVPYCEVAGFTEPGVILTINDIRQELETDGSFSAVVPVDSSEFTITVSAEDDAGNRTTKVVTRMPLDSLEIASLSISVSPESIVADNVSTSVITVIGLNHYQQPVSGVDVNLSTNSTGGYLSESSISLFGGVGTAMYHAGISGTQRKTVVITVSKGGVAASAQLILLPDFPAEPDD